MRCLSTLRPKAVILVLNASSPLSLLQHTSFGYKGNGEEATCTPRSVGSYKCLECKILTLLASSETGARGEAGIPLPLPFCGVTKVQGSRLLYPRSLVANKLPRNAMSEHQYCARPVDIVLC